MGFLFILLLLIIMSKEALILGGSVESIFVYISVKKVFGSDKMFREISSNKKKEYKTVKWNSVGDSVVGKLFYLGKSKKFHNTICVLEDDDFKYSINCGAYLKSELEKLYSAGTIYNGAMMKIVYSEAVDVGRPAKMKKYKIYIDDDEE